MSLALIPFAVALLAAPAPTAPGPQHDFDFEIGTWRTHLTRLVRPLTGSRTWVSYEGTTVVRKVWEGRANLVELEVDGPAGHLEGLSLRLYNPDSRQWSLNFSNSRTGAPCRVGSSAPFMPYAIRVCGCHASAMSRLSQKLFSKSNG